MRSLPNLNAIRAFDAAARHGSFARAADELGVSHAAVSRHMRNLEAELGVALFERHARHVVLTGEGSLFARTAANALSSLEIGTGRLRRGGGRNTVTLDVDTDLAMLWLMPRLTDDALRALNVHLDVRVRPEPPRAVLGDADLALTWSEVACIGYRAEPFLPLEAFPVAAPLLLERGPGPDDPKVLTSHRLIHDRGIYWWRSYFEASDLSFDAATDHLFFNRTYLCMDAAVRGLGIAMGDNAISGHHLADGSLVRLPGPTLPARDQYYLLTPDTPSLSRAVRQVRDWLLVEAKAHSKMHA